jgi:hypothetical protein
LPTPSETRARLIDELGRAGHGATGRALLDGLIDLTRVGEEEDESSRGLTARQVLHDFDCGASAAEAISSLAVLAIAADIDR